MEEQVPELSGIIEALLIGASVPLSVDRLKILTETDDGKEIRAQGFTDARGVFEGRNVRGSVMVVAEADGHYALYRR